MVKSGSVVVSALMFVSASAQPPAKKPLGTGEKKCLDDKVHNRLMTIECNSTLAVMDPCKYKPMANQTKDESNQCKRAHEAHGSSKMPAGVLDSAVKVNDANKDMLGKVNVCLQNTSVIDKTTCRMLDDMGLQMSGALGGKKTITEAEKVMHFQKIAQAQLAESAKECAKKEPEDKKKCFDKAKKDMGALMGKKGEQQSVSDREFHRELEHQLTEIAASTMEECRLTIEGNMTKQAMQNCFQIVVEAVNKMSMDNKTLQDSQIKDFIDKGCKNRAGSVLAQCNNAGTEADKKMCREGSREVLESCQGKPISDFENKKLVHEAGLKECKDLAVAGMGVRTEAKPNVAECLLERTGQKKETDTKKAAMQESKLKREAGEQLLGDEMAACFADKGKGAVNATCIADAVNANSILLKEMIGGKTDADKEKHLKKMAKQVMLNRVGDMFSECMDIELQGIAKPWPNEKHKAAHALCAAEFASSMGASSTDPQADILMHHATLFEGMQQCIDGTDEPDEAAMKTCRKSAKDAAKAKGVHPSKALQVARIGQNRAAAKVWSACLGTLVPAATTATATDDATCKAVAGEALVDMSGFEGFEDSRIEKIRNLAWADFDGVLTTLKEAESITVDVIEGMEQKSCDSKMVEALKKVATDAKATVPKLGNVTVMECSVADGAAHHTIEISAPGTDAAARMEISENLTAMFAGVQAAPMGRRLAMLQVAEAGAMATTDECSQGDATCPKAKVVSTSAATPAPAGTAAGTSAVAGTAAATATTASAFGVHSTFSVLVLMGTSTSLV